MYCSHIFYVSKLIKCYGNIFECLFKLHIIMYMCYDDVATSGSSQDFRDFSPFMQCPIEPIMCNVEFLIIKKFDDI